MKKLPIKFPINDSTITATEKTTEKTTEKILCFIKVIFMSPNREHAAVLDALPSATFVTKM